MNSLSEFIVAKINELAFVKVSPSDELISSGVLDSVNIVELSVEIERHLGIQIPFEEINAANFKSVERICEYTNGLQK